MEIQDKCFEYLRSVNPIAQKIAEDIDNIKNKNKTQWNNLDSKEKESIIDNTLIEQNLVEKYEGNFDEHFEDYGPISNFSWFTRSQLNLFTHINVKPEKNKTPMKKSDVLSPLKKTKNIAPKPSENANKHVKNKGSRDDKTEKICSKGVAKPKTPPPPPPAKLSVVEQKGLLEHGQQGDDIPKTGFDFLDNW